MSKVGVFIPHTLLFLVAQLAPARHQAFTLGRDGSVKFAFPEDTILSKCKCFRMDSEVVDRQWQYILGALKTKAGDSDLENLYKWANE